MTNPGNELHPSAQELRRLVLDVLFPTNDTEASHRHQLLRILSETITNGDAQVDESFQAVFADIAANEVAFNAIRSTMDPFIPEDDEEGGEYEGAPEENHLISILNKVLQLLRELNDIGNGQQTASPVKIVRPGGPRKPSQR